jgi:tetratricopeptide (TPR) repeat protein
MIAQLLKKPNMRLALLVLFSAIALCTTASQAQTGPLATVLTVKGRLEVRRHSVANFVALPLRTSLFASDHVRTGPASKATLLFTDGAQVRLNANTSIEITSPTVSRGKRSLFRVIGGEVWARLRFGQAVETRTAIAGVRGTQIHLTVQEDGTSTLFVEEGEVEFFNPFGEVVVATGQQSIARPGQAPTSPITIQNGGLILEWTLDLNRDLIPREKYFVSADRRLLQSQINLRAMRAQNARDDAASRLAYGDILFDTRRFEDALREYQAAAQLSPADSTMQLRLGYALLELNRLEDAETAFRRALNGAPQDRQNAPGLVGLTQVALARGEAAAAQQLAEQALASDETAGESRGEARLALGVALMRQPSRLDEAARVFETALRDEPASLHSQAHAWLALVRLAQDDVAAALRHARLATEMAPQSALAHANLALVLFYAAQPREAEVEARRALQINPDAPAAQVALGQALLAQGRTDEAERIAAQSVALDPNLPQARYLLGVANASRRDYTHAARELQASLRLAPDFLPAASTLARVYNLMGRPRDAVATLQALLPRHRRTHAVQGALGEVLYEQGRYSEAAAEYRKALGGNPASALYQDGLARTLIYSNQLNAAIVAAQRAVSLAPGVGQYHATLGLAYEFGGLGAQAEREFRSALTLDPQNALALAQLAYRHEGADLRPAATSFTQGFLLDPAVSNRLLRGGIHTELTPRVSNHSQRNFALTHRTTASDGRFHLFGFLNRTGEGGLRSNDQSSGYDLAQFATLTPHRHTNLYFNLRGQRAQQGLPGPVSAAVSDDNATFRYGQAQLAARQQLGQGKYLWLGLFGNTSRHLTRDPNRDSFLDEPTELPIAQQRYNSNAVEPEVRFDFSLGSAAQRSNLLSVGAARTRTRFDSRRDLFLGPGNPVGQNGTTLFRQEDRGVLAYAQLQQQWGEHVSLIAQLRRQHLNRSRSSLLTLPGQTPLSASSREARALWLPSLLATYQADKRTTLRFAFNQRLTDVTTSNFAPTETLLTTERSALPGGTPDRMRLAQLDIERYLSPRDFLKLFVWQTTANDVQIGGSDLLGFGGGLAAADAPFLLVNRWRGYGAGVRYERRLGRSLFADAGVFMRRISNQSRGPSFDRIYSGQSAPYEPARQAQLSINYLDGSGYKAGLGLRYTGAFFADTPLAVGRPRFPARLYTDLLLAREPSVNYEVFFKVTNLFNSSQLQFYDFPVGQRRLEFGATRRF